MHTIRLPTNLRLYGPRRRRSGDRRRSAECRRTAGGLARSHYENFTVASWLLPAELRPHFCNVYAYCRWSDDLADETAGGAASLQLLDWWQSQLDDCYRASTAHPVFVALQPNHPRVSKFRSSRFAICSSPFAKIKRQTLRDIRRSARLLPELGQSGGAIGAVLGPLPRRSARRLVRLDLHRPATGQLLARCGPRLCSWAEFICRKRAAAAPATTRQCSPGTNSIRSFAKLIAGRSRSGRIACSTLAQPLVVNGAGSSAN